MRNSLGAGLLPIAVLVSCGAESPPPLAPLGPLPTASVVAIVGARVLPMDADRVIEQGRILVRDGRIVAVGPANQVEIPTDAAVVDAKGRFVIPGLADMHVHLRRSHLGEYVRHGVTTVRNMWGFPQLLGWTRREGARLVPVDDAAPTIHSVSPGVDGPPAQWPETQLVTDPAEADALVARLAADGWTHLKVYTRLRRDVYDALIAAARAHGMVPVGHVPLSVPVEHALASGQRSIEHFGGYDRALGAGGGSVGWANVAPDRMRELARLTREAGVWNCPTNAVHEAILRGASADVRARAAANRHAFVRALRAEGARILAGSDAGIDLTAPGISLHDELAQLVAAGLTPYEALRIATVDAAEFLGETGQFGVVASGARADLVLLDGDPRRDLRHARSPAAVMVRGRWLAP